jgi:hypothetical protein
MYIGDVGQEGYEEIDLQPANTPGGVNYGWNIMEGFHCYRPGVGCDQTGLTLPIYEYPHTGCDAVVGGYVYRGYVQPLVGAYLFADECQGNIWALSQQDGQWVSTNVMTNNLLITSFGEDEAGEIYATNFSPGALYHVVAIPRTP